MLCDHCKTVVEFPKEDYAKLVFQDGKKFFWHMECFNNTFQRRNDEVENKASDVRVGALDPQGNLFMGVDDDLIQSTVVS